jgi:cytochrome c biogenesis protein CcdA
MAPGIEGSDVQYNNELNSRQGVGTGGGNISLAFFFDPGCKCTPPASAVLREIEAQYPDVNQFWYNVTYTGNYTKWIDFMDPSAYNVPSEINDKTPFLFIGDYYLNAEAITFENVSAMLELYWDRDVPLWPTWEVAWTMHMALFYDPMAEITDNLLEDVQLLNSTWNQNFSHLIIHHYPLDNPTNRLWLDAYFAEFELSQNSPFTDPQDIVAGVFIDDEFLLNSDINYSSLNDTVTKYSGQNIPLKDITINLTGGKICVIFFRSLTCGECHKAEKILIDMKAKYPDLDVREYNIADPDNVILLRSYYKYYDVNTSEQGTLAVFIGDRYFVDADKLGEEIEDIIKEKSEGCPCPEVKADKEIVKKDFTSFTVFAVMFAGLVDSINPCAIATLIFFIGYLSTTGRTKKQVLIIGISYTLGIFITYMALGLGIYALIATSSNELEFFSRMLYPAMIILAIVFGLYSLYDFIKARAGKKEEMKLQLPKPVKKLIGRVIKHQVKLRYFVIIAIVTGVLISTLEFLCTGQLYLPTIMVIYATVPEFQTQAFMLLFLYNLMFIVPLVIIFSAVYFGMKSEDLQEVLERNRAKVKLLTALVFFILGVFLIWYSWEFVFV